MRPADWFDAVRKGNAWHGPREFTPDQLPQRTPHARPPGRLRRIARAVVALIGHRP